jgi:hypothetical protein
MYAALRRYEGVFYGQSGAEASSERAAGSVEENPAGLLPNPPVIAAGEVVAHG